MFSEEGLLVAEHAGNLLSSGEQFNRKKSYDNGLGLSKAVGGAYGASAGFLIGGPIGAAVLAPIGSAASGLLYDVGIGIRSWITGKEFS